MQKWYLLLRNSSRTLLGVNDAYIASVWVENNLVSLLDQHSGQGLLTCIWPLILMLSMHQRFNKFEAKMDMLRYAIGWISGVPYNVLFEWLLKDWKLLASTIRGRAHAPTIETMVDICDNLLAFEATLIVAAIIELAREGGQAELVVRLEALQKSLKYGLPAGPAIHIYEFGYCDRTIAIDLALGLESEGISSRSSVGRALRKNRNFVKQVLSDMPAYFSTILA